MSTSSRFTKFLSNLTLTSDQLADAQTKYDGVAKNSIATTTPEPSPGAPEN